MKVGIVTPFDAANYGAYLQAYANKTYIESLGHEVYMIKWRSEQERKQNYYPRPRNWKHRIRLIQSRGYHDLVYKVMTDALKEFNVLDYDDAEIIDLFVLGSDEIWNVSVPEFQNPLFYGKNKYNTRSIAYAPSISDADMTEYESHKDIKQCIKDIEIVGVRDSRTCELVNSIKGEEPNIVCDPTMFLEINQYNVSDKRIITDKYILVYSYNISSTYIRYLKRFANDNGLKLVAACLYQNWCDINIVCTPLEFIGVIRDAEYVYTSTFHGAIFTLLNHKNCIITTKMRKVKDLLEWTGMLDKVGVAEETAYDDFKLILSSSQDYGAFERCVNERRTNSRELLRKYLIEDSEQ